MSETITEPAALRSVNLDDRFDPHGGMVLLNGHQALVRALLLQSESDRRAGLNTAGHVSGYRGSPLGGLDQALWSASAALDAARVTFEPAVNEELAATAIWGTQQIAVMGEATVDGVFGLWYGKGPGVDRAGDALKHGNYAGTHRRGGVLVVAGDDHQGKSSTVAHHSQQALAAASIPTLYPADVGEFVRFALLGWALSRYSGCWVGFKVVNETAEQAMTCAFDLDAFDVQLPDPGALPLEGVHYRGAYAPAMDEIILRRWRLPLVQRFAQANGFDRVALGEPGARFGIVTAGKCWHEVRLALRALGLDGERAATVGLAVYKVGLVWPLEPHGLVRFAAGKDELLFVEDKTAFVETQAAAALYNLAQRPRISGKCDRARCTSAEQRRRLRAARPGAGHRRAAARCGLCGCRAADAARRAERVAQCAARDHGAGRREAFAVLLLGLPAQHLDETARRQPRAGRHRLPRHGAVRAAEHAGCRRRWAARARNWLGMRRYTARKHVFQNLGDGTYYHSGLLAIRAAVASGANITYKILYNDAVAMTGGQPIDGPISVAQIAHQVRHEGVAIVVLVSDDPDRHRGAELPAGVRIEHRDRLDAIQRELRDTPGCTVLLYEQTCAAEKRRRRKRGELPDPGQRLFIDAAVCEGCGDCSEQSSCVAIEPLDTAFGRKRAHQSVVVQQGLLLPQGLLSVLRHRGRRPAARAGRRRRARHGLLRNCRLPAARRARRPGLRRDDPRHRRHRCHHRRRGAGDGGAPRGQCRQRPTT